MLMDDKLKICSLESLQFRAIERIKISNPLALYQTNLEWFVSALYFLSFGLMVLLFRIQTQAIVFKARKESFAR